jgi:chemotaxis protein histidine kinase CheA
MTDNYNVDKITLTRKSQLAKLLAKEDITVIYGNFSTASFDTVTRVIRIPTLKGNLSDNILDLFVGHEVAHALFTCTETYIKFIKDLPKSRQSSVKTIFNVIEDVRIERLMEAEYQGLGFYFKVAYEELHNDLDFFRLKDVKESDMHFITRLNVAAKSRNIIKYSFDSDEQKFYDAAFKTETIEDAIALTLEIEQFLKDNEQTPKEQEKPEEVPDPVEEESSSPDSEPESNLEEQDSDTEEQESESETDTEEETEEDSDSDSDTEEETEEDSDTEEHESEEDSDSDTEEETEEDSDTEEDDELNGGNDSMNSSTLSDMQDLEENESTFSDIIDSPENPDSNYFDSYISEYSKEEIQDMVTPNSKFFEVCNKLSKGFSEFTNEEYTSFMREINPIINNMVKDFNMLKSAASRRRATQSKTGKINPLKLSSYKFNQDIFLQKTTFAEGKNHGVIAFIDFSGSIENELDGIISQCIIMSEFYQRIGIPFDFYSFTSGNYAQAQITHWLSSSARRSTTAIIRKCLYMRGNRKGIFTSYGVDIYEAQKLGVDINDCRDMFYTGGTPLNNTIVLAHSLVSDFNQKHNIEKSSTLFITDGSSSPLSLNEEYNTYTQIGSLEPSAGYRGKMTITLDFFGKTTIITNPGETSLSITNILFDSLGEISNVIGFFVSDKNGKNAKNCNAIILRQDNAKEYYNDEKTRSIGKELRANGIYDYGKIGGYSAFSIINPPRSFEATSFAEVDTAERKASIKQQFKKYTTDKAKFKKYSKQIVEQFA